MARKAIDVSGGSMDSVDKQDLNDNFIELYAADATQLARGKTVTIGTPTAGAANTTTCTLTVTDATGAAVAAIHTLDVWISDDTDGNGLTATAASGTLTATAGTILTALTAKKHIRANTNATGVLTLALVDSAKTQGERFCCTNPTTGQIVVGAATVTASYGT